MPQARSRFHKTVALVVPMLLCWSATAGAFTWSPRADTIGESFGRGLHGSGVINNTIYLAGGGFIGTSLWQSYTSAEAYDPVRDRWSNLAPMAERRAAVASAVASYMGNPRLYVFGGVDLTDFPIYHFSHSDAEEYDPMSNTWRTVGRNIPDGGRTWGMCAATVGNRIYLMGGSDDIFNNLSARLASYDPDTDTYTRLADMPARVSDGACVAVGNYLLWYGGYEHVRGWGALPNPFVYYYDTVTNTWSTASAQMPTPRANATAVTDGTTVWVMGGWNGSGQYSGLYKTVDEHDWMADFWTPNLPDPLACVPDDGLQVRGRSSFSLHWANDGTQTRLYAIGGNVGISLPTRCNETSPQPGTCVSAAYNLVVPSLLLVEQTGCGNSQVAAHWRLQNPGPLTDVYNLHAIHGRTALATDRTSVATAPEFREPYATTPIAAGVRPLMTCFSPTLTGAGVAFYGLWQSDSCTGMSLDDVP